MTWHLHRRALIGGAIGASLAAAAPRAGAAAEPSSADLHGALDASQEGLISGSPDDQSSVMRQALSRAADAGRPLFLPPGRYEVSRLDLPRYAHLVGVPGQSSMVFGGDGYLIRASGALSVRLECLIVDGGDRPLGPEAQGLVQCDDAGTVVVEDCEIVGSADVGLAIRRSSGRVDRTAVSGAGTVGLYLSGARGMVLTENTVSDCGDTGILVEGSAEGADDTIIRGNRVSRIKARSGGTGQHGNGINLVQASGVIISDNRVDDCVFSAIRCYSSQNLQISGNIATRSGETAIYVEFAHEGAIVSGNLVDDAALGISLANLDHGGRLSVCSGNLVRNIRGGRSYPGGNPEIGAGIYAEADVAITGNVVENALQGLLLGWGPYLRDLLATGNVIRRCDIGIGVTVVEEAGPAVIADNLISGSTFGAIVGMRWVDTATGDLAVSGAADFPHLTIKRNRVT